MRRILKKHQRGFTLIEAIMVIVITGIIAGMVAVFIRQPIDAYMDTARRAALSDIADTAARRVARDLQGALPNSVRVDPSGLFLEFIPISAAGRYRAEVGTGAGDDPLVFNAADSSFDILGPTININAGESLVVYNLGISGLDAYEASPGNLRAATSGTGLSKVAFTGIVASPLLYPSPNSRFQIVGTPVTYACDLGTGTLWRYSSYGFHPAVPGALATLDAYAGVTKAALATNLAAPCSFAYDVGALQRNGLVSISLSLSMDGETVTLQHQVNVDNAP